VNAWILAGGRLTLTEELERRRREPPHIVVAADGGIAHARLLGVRPLAWVGDFDSSEGLAEEFADVPRLGFPRDKDATDFELALAHAVRHGATRVTVWGAFGGRFDHTLALAVRAVEETGHGLPTNLHSGDESGVPLVPGVPLRVAARPGQTLSVLALDDLVGLTLRGVRWPLADANVSAGSGWTVSNEVAGPVVEAEVRAGRALVIQTWP
jgi:thiamine pyrophosphokinase